LESEVNGEKINELNNRIKNDNQLIDNLNKLLLFEKEKNQILTKENQKLNDDINLLKINKFQLENEKNKFKEKIIILEKELNNKNSEINDYIIQIKKLNEDKNEIISINPGEKILSILFITQGNQDISNYSMACKDTDLFVKLEERLYNDYPNYKNHENYFMVNTRRILRFKTLKENKIKNNDIISVFAVDL